MYNVKIGSTKGEQFLYEGRENLTSVVIDVTKSSNWKFLDWLYSIKIQVVVFNWALSISSIPATTTIRLNGASIDNIWIDRYYTFLGGSLC